MANPYLWAGLMQGVGSGVSSYLETRQTLSDYMRQEAQQQRENERAESAIDVQQQQADLAKRKFEWEMQQPDTKITGPSLLNALAGVPNLMPESQGPFVAGINEYAKIGGYPTFDLPGPLGKAPTPPRQLSDADILNYYRGVTANPNLTSEQINQVINAGLGAVGKAPGSVSPPPIPPAGPTSQAFGPPAPVISGLTLPETRVAAKTAEAAQPDLKARLDILDDIKGLRLRGVTPAAIAVSPIAATAKLLGVFRTTKEVEAYAASIPSVSPAQILAKTPMPRTTATGGGRRTGEGGGKAQPDKSDIIPLTAPEIRTARQLGFNTAAIKQATSRIGEVFANEKYFKLNEKGEKTKLNALGLARVKKINADEAAIARGEKPGAAKPAPRPAPTGLSKAAIDHLKNVARPAFKKYGKLTRAQVMAGLKAEGLRYSPDAAYKELKAAGMAK